VVANVKDKLALFAPPGSNHPTKLACVADIAGVVRRRVDVSILSATQPTPTRIFAADAAFLNFVIDRAPLRSIPVATGALNLVRVVARVAAESRVLRLGHLERTGAFYALRSRALV